MIAGEHKQHIRAQAIKGGIVNQPKISVGLASAARPIIGASATIDRIIDRIVSPSGIVPRTIESGPVGKPSALSRRD